MLKIMSMPKTIPANNYSCDIHLSDIQGREFPEPRLKTKVKMRYDYRFLYIGALLEEPDVWSNVTLHDGPGERLTMCL